MIFLYNDRCTAINYTQVIWSFYGCLNIKQLKLCVENVGLWGFAVWNNFSCGISVILNVNLTYINKFLIAIFVLNLTYGEVVSV